MWTRTETVLPQGAGAGCGGGIDPNVKVWTGVTRFVRAPDVSPPRPIHPPDYLRGLSLEELEGTLEEHGWLSEHEGREVFRRLHEARERPSPTAIVIEKIREDERTKLVQFLRDEANGLAQDGEAEGALWFDRAARRIELRGLDEKSEDVKR